jgi:hypothetical protein
MYSSGSPAANEKSIGEMLSRVWQGKFESADCFQSWDEGALWNCAAVIEFNVGAPGELITDGSHVYLKDYDGRSWFLRLLPAAQ